MNLTGFHIPPFGESTKRLLWVVVVVAAFAAGYRLSGPQHTATPAIDKQVEAPSTPAKATKATLWTCSMHPQIKLPKPGKCPICGMDLIPLVADEDEQAPSAARYSMSKEAKELAQVETATVKRDHAKIKVRMVGMVYEDETHAATLTSRVDGRLDAVYVDYTGVHVTKGDPMVKIWSPTLIKSQVELFESTRSSGPDDSVTKGAEEKLIQQGLTPEQIKEIKEKKKPILEITLRAPISGTVMRKLAILGQFVKEGSEMYNINDLSRVWVKMDAYETDMPWVRYGQDVNFTTPALPGKTFKGKILFIDPTLDTKTRSVKVRVEADNPDLSLRPGMFVTAELESECDETGRVIKPEWAGKYICPIHPTDEGSPVQGICPDSGIQLRPASAYGYADDPNVKLPLVIPASAPLITGKRSVVYIEVPNADRPTYELREVTLGPRAGDRYVVYNGLTEGEKVVTNGNFQIDSAMQILGKPSMMNEKEAKTGTAPMTMPGQAPMTTPAPAAPKEEVVGKLKAPKHFLEALSPLVTEYLTLKDALVDEKTQDAAKYAGHLDKLLADVKTDGFDQKATTTWKTLAQAMSANLKKLAESRDVAAQRKAFDPLSEAFAKVLMGFGHVMKDPLYVFYCPMAFDGEGAHWVEGKDERRNPYFGRKPFKGQDMLTCGELAEKVPPLADNEKTADHPGQEHAR